MSDTTPGVWVPIEKQEAAELLAEGVHVGLRKGSEAPSSGPLWKAIAESDDSAWMDAMQYAIDGLEYMGYQVCSRVPADYVAPTEEKP